MVRQIVIPSRNHGPAAHPRWMKNGFYALHAPFLTERRTRGFIQCSVTGNPGLAGEADHDLGSGGHHAAGRGNLLPGDSAAYDLQRQAGRAGRLDSHTQRLTQKRGNSDPVRCIDYDAMPGNMRRARGSGGLGRRSALDAPAWELWAVRAQRAMAKTQPWGQHSAG